MILAVLTALLLSQTPQQPVAQKLAPAPTETQTETPGHSEQQKWWSQLSKEEQQEMRRRMSAMREMSPEARQDLEIRRKVFEQEKIFLLKQLTEEDRATYEALGAREKMRFVRDQVHQRLRDRGEHLRERFPNAEKGRKAFEESRRKQVMQGIALAAEEGWLGPHAVEHFMEAPLHEAMQALMEIQKWQFLEKAAETGFWKQNSMDEEHQRRLSELPAPEFFREIRGIAEGRPQGPPWMRRDGHGRPGGREGAEGRRGREGQGAAHEGRHPGGRRPPVPPEDGGRRR